MAPNAERLCCQVYQAEVQKALYGMKLVREDETLSEEVKEKLHKQLRQDLKEASFEYNLALAETLLKEKNPPAAAYIRTKVNYALSDVSNLRSLTDDERRRVKGILDQCAEPPMECVTREPDATVFDMVATLAKPWIRVVIWV